MGQTMTKAQRGAGMATLDKQGTIALEELVVSSLATADAVAKLLIEKVMSHFDCVTVVLVGYHP